MSAAELGFANFSRSSEILFLNFFAFISTYLTMSVSYISKYL